MRAVLRVVKDDRRIAAEAAALAVRERPGEALSRQALAALEAHVGGLPTRDECRLIADEAAVRY